MNKWEIKDLLLSLNIAIQSLEGSRQYVSSERGFDPGRLLIVIDDTKRLLNQLENSTRRGIKYKTRLM